MDISISTTIFKSAEHVCSFERGLELLSQAGFNRIELSRKHDDIATKKRLIEDMGMSVWAVHGTLGGDAISSNKQSRRQSVEDEFRRMEEAAVYAPCPYVIHYFNRHNAHEVGVNFRKSVEDLSAKAIELGLVLAVETAPYKSHVERYPDSLEIADLARSFQSPNVGVCVDLNHSNLKEDLILVCENCSGIIANIHVSDNHGEWEDHLPPGEGVIDFPNVFEAVRKNGYHGPCNVECHLNEPLTVERLREIHRSTERLLGRIDGFD